MPFSGFRERLGSTSKQERDLIQPRASSNLTPHNSNDGPSDNQSVLTTSSTASSTSIALEQLKTHPISADPVQFVQDAISPLFTWNPKHEQVTLEDLLEYHVPRYFDPEYRHSFNLMEADVHSWIHRTRAVHQNCKKTRIRFLKTLIDTAEKQSMQHALVSLQYEVIITVPDRDDDIKILAHGIYRIKHGKLISGTIVVDLHDAVIKAPEIPACVIA